MKPTKPDKTREAQICPRCKKPITPKDKVSWMVIGGVPREVHERCLPKETRERVKESFAKIEAEASRISMPAAVKSVLRGPRILAKPEEFTPGIFSCAKCRDTGWRETEPDAQGYTRAYECECSRRRRAEARVRALENRYSRFKGMTFGTYRPKHPTQRAALKQCQDFVKAWPLVEGTGLLLYGPPGVGKTGLIKCVAVELVKKASAEIMWYRATQVALQLRQTFDKNSDDQENRFIKEIGMVELLLLDDMGAENISDYNKSVFFEFLEMRHVGNRPTLITTNLEEETREAPGPDGRLKLLPSLEARLGAPLYSRLNEMCRFVHVLGKDRRMQK